MNKFRILIVAIIFSGKLFTGCEDSVDEINPTSQKQGIEQDASDVSVENGYLNFKSQEVFNDYFEKIESALNSDNGLKSSTAKIINVDGFVSLAERVKSSSQLKSSDASEEDVTLEMVNELIPVEPLHYLLDTISRVKVGDDIYQVTPFGSFIYQKEYEDEFNSLIVTFPDRLFDFSNQVDSITYMYGNIKLIDTYQHLKNKYFDENVFLGSITDDNDENVGQSSSLKSANSKIDSKLTSKYGLSTHKVNGNIWHNNRRSNYFDSNTRVRARLYDYNWGVYKGAGFTCKFQKKKKKTITVRKYGFFGPKRTITLYTYWSSTINSEMVIGMDYFEGYTEYTNFGLSVDNNGFPINYNHHRTFANGVAKLVKKGTNELFSEVRGWANRGWLFDTKMEFSILGNDINLLRKAYDAGNDAIISEVRSQVYNTIQNAAPTRYVKRDEKLYPNRKWVTYWGVNNYSNRSYIKVSLGLPAYGFPVAVNKFHVKEVYIFGAAKFNGQWKGVRLHF
jgi:hypothetical protein